MSYNKDKTKIKKWLKDNGKDKTKVDKMKLDTYEETIKSVCGLFNMTYDQYRESK